MMMPNMPTMVVNGTLLSPSSVGEPVKDKSDSDEMRKAARPKEKGNECKIFKHKLRVQKTKI